MHACVRVCKIGVSLLAAVHLLRADLRGDKDPQTFEMSVSVAMKAVVSGNNYCQNISNLDVRYFDWTEKA